MRSFAQEIWVDVCERTSHIPSFEARLGALKILQFERQMCRERHVVGCWEGSWGESDPIFPQEIRLPFHLLSDLFFLCPHPSPKKRCLKITKILRRRRLHGEGQVPIAPRAQEAGTSAQSAFCSRQPNSFTHCFLLKMKNCDLSCSVLIDSEGMDLPKQKTIPRTSCAA